MALTLISAAHCALPLAAAGAAQTWSAGEEGPSLSTTGRGEIG